MQADVRRATFARIGRSYPRVHPQSEAPERAPRARLQLRLTIAGGLIALISAVGLAGWLVLR